MGWGCLGEKLLITGWVPKMRHQENRTFFVALSCSITNAASCQTLATIGKTCVRR